MRTSELKRNEPQKPASFNSARPTPATSGLNPGADRILSFQQTLGNQAVQRMLRSPAQGRTRMQPKLVVGQPGDVYEQEADRVAASVMRMPDPVHPAVIEKGFSRAPASEVRRQPGDFIFEVPQEEEILQTKANSGSAPEVPPGLEGELHAIDGRGEPLPASLRSFFEPRLGYDLSPVRVHTGAPAHRMAESVNARAFTLGRHIVFGEGHYAPTTGEGRQLLAHELTHTVQQGVVSRRPDVSPAARPTTQAGSAGQLRLQRKACNFYVYDSTEPTSLGAAWKWAAVGLAMKASGGYYLASGDTIEEMLQRLISGYATEGCDCIEEIQFLSHGSPGNAMSISKTGDELTINDFNIPELEKYGYSRRDAPGFQEWNSKLTPRQYRLVLLRRILCGPDAEIYYRSCSGFQGKTGQDFAKASAAFWRAKVIGHTKVIALSQPGRKELKPGQEPYWSESEGTEAPTPKKPVGIGADQKPKKN